MSHVYNIRIILETQTIDAMLKEEQPRTEKHLRLERTIENAEDAKRLIDEFFEEVKKL